jgi:hypothetical protein
MTNAMEEFLRLNRKKNYLKFAAWMLVVAIITCFSIGAIFMIIDVVVKTAFGV